MKLVQRELFKMTFVQVAAKEHDQIIYDQVRFKKDSESEKKIFPYYWISNDTERRFAIWYVEEHQQWIVGDFAKR